MKYVFLAFCLMTYVNAAEPLSACRVKTETFQKHGYLSNNAGCVISKFNDAGEYEYLLVRVKKKGYDAGWGFPGGTLANKKADLKTDDSGKPRSPYGQKIAQTVGFDYTEPAVCTAARETHEEIGAQVVVGDLIAIQKYFIAFECFLPKNTKLSALDKKEVQQIGWYSAKQMQAKGFLRFESNLDIVKKFEESKKSSPAK